MNIRLTLFFLMIFSKALFAQSVAEHGRLHVQGTQLMDQHNKPVVLQGMSFGWSCFHPRFYTAGTVSWLHKDWHCDIVRAAMGVEPDSGYIKDPVRSAKLVTTVADAAIKEGIYVIIDWHSHNIRLKEADDFFRAMAKKYKDHPNVIYELFNEPDYETWPEVKAYAITLIKTIRAIDPNNIILVGSPHWDQDIDMPASDPIKGFDNLMYTMHFYAGTHGAFLRARTDSAIAAGLPVFISESAGMEATGDGPINYEEWARYRAWISKNKLSWITWSVSDKDESCSVLQKSAGNNGKWHLTDLKEWGVVMRNVLRTGRVK